MVNIFLCGACGEIFTTHYLVLLHQSEAHRDYEQVSSNTQHSSNQLNIPAFFNNGNIGACGGGVTVGGSEREINGNVGAVGDSEPMEQRQTFPGRANPAVPSSSMRTQQINDQDERMAEFARLRQQTTQGTVSRGSNIAATSNTMRLDDGTQNAMRTIPTSSASGARVVSSSMGGEACEVQVYLKRTTEGPIHIQTATGGHEIGTIQQGSRISANYVPNGFSAVPQGNAHFAGPQEQASLPTEPGASGTGIPQLMGNLTAMQLLSREHLSRSTNPNRNFLSRDNEKACSSAGPESSLTKFNEKKVETKVQQMQTDKVLSERVRKFCVKHPYIGPRAKNSVPPAAEGNVKGGKTSLPKNNHEHNFCFLPTQRPPIRGSGTQVSPSQPLSGEVHPPTSPTMPTLTKEVITAAATVFAVGLGVDPVGKTTASTSKAKEVRGQVPPQETCLNPANGLNPIQPSAKNDNGVQRNGTSTKLAHGRVVPSTSNVSSKKSAVANAACVNARGLQGVAKKPPPPPKTTKNRTRTGGMKITLAKLKEIVPTMPGTDYAMPDLSAVGSYIDKWGKQIWICLVCSQEEPEESSQGMICCDECDNWYHCHCVGIIEDVAVGGPWFCKICISKVCVDVDKMSVFPEIFKK